MTCKNGGLFSSATNDQNGLEQAPGEVLKKPPQVSDPSHAAPSSALVAVPQQNVPEEIVLKSDPNWKLVQMNEKHMDRLIKIQSLCYEPCYRDSRQAYVDRTHLFPEGNASLFVPTKFEESCSPSPGSSKRRKKKEARSFKMAGYIITQPFNRGDVNEVNDTTEMTEWLEKHKGATLSRGPEQCLYIHEIAVHPDFRGQGLTRPLIEFTENLARKCGFQWMSLVALSSAFSFWKRTGYTLVRELDYEGHTCYYMEKRLD